MMENAEFKQIRLNPEVRALLDDYKMDGESYSIAIGRLFKENEILRENNEAFIKMADSIEYPSMESYIYFVLNDCFENWEFGSGSDSEMADGIFYKMDLAWSYDYKGTLKIIDKYISKNKEHKNVLTILESMILTECKEEDSE